MYTWAFLPLVGGCVLLALVARPASSEGTRAADRALIAVLVACVLQLVPLPAFLAEMLSPARARIQEVLRLGALPSWVTLSIAPKETAGALLVCLGAAFMYWVARRTFETGGVRIVCRGIGWIGFALACFAIAQRSGDGGRIYGFWVPVDKGALPYGPFVNRNHCATWLLLSIPLCFGYLMARLRRLELPGRSDAVSVRHTIDGRSVWLAIAGTAMVLALALSLSRSGIAAFAVSAIVTVGATRGRMDWIRTMWVAAVVLLGAAALARFADVGAVLNRFVEAVEAGRQGRIAIWRDTLPMIRDFGLTGSGIGTYETAMLVYQTGDRTYYFNQAHNEFLQVAAEGGLMVGVPAGVALVALIALSRRRLEADASGMFWIRAGAAAGLAGVALQSVWETGLRVPANALLAAVLAAILTHQPRATVPLQRGSSAPAAGGRRGECV